MVEVLVANGGQAGSAESEEKPLPPLREDLGLFPGTRNAYGEKSWMLHDPVRNRYFRIGVREFELLTLWGQGLTPSQLSEQVAQHGYSATLEDILKFGEFLVQQELVQVNHGAGARFAKIRRMREQAWWKKLLHNYLFFRIPLIRPDPLLDRIYPRLRFLFTRTFAGVTALVGLLSLVLVVRQWDLFVSTFMGFLSWEGALAFGSALVLVKILHECGHALACRHYGLRVPSIGVALIVMWPVMYTDATEAWRLTSRKARLAIASAGMLVEVSLACYATLMWVMLPDGLMRSVAFTLATTTWLMSLAVNLNPMMRFDGYYIFSDLFNIPNLQERGFELGRNRLRHALFGVPRVRDPGLLPKQHRIAILWAYATWVYRFFLFLGIAFLVYEFFFKALGIFLFVVEIWWFLAAPIWREVRNWKALSATMTTQRKRWAALIGGAALLLVLLPWSSSFYAPALLRPDAVHHLYPSETSRLVAVAVEQGDQVEKGELMFELTAPDLESELARIEADVRYAEQDLIRVLTVAEGASDRQVAEESLARARAALTGLRERQQKLRVLAPSDGVIRDMPPQLRPGLWVEQKQKLGVLVDAAAGWVVHAYVAEEHLRFVNVGQAVRFYPEDYTLPPLTGTVEQVDAVDTAILPEPYLAEIYGGGIPVRVNQAGQAVPEQAVYRIKVAVNTAEATLPVRVVRGEVRMTGDSRSLLWRAATFVAGVLVRESGF